MQCFRGTLVAFCLFVFALLPTAARGATIQWLVGNGGNGHFYDYVPGATTWGQAETKAAAMTFNGMPGYLTTITSAAENNFIIGNFNQRGFLGGSDAAVEGEWRWVVGPEAGQLFFVGQYPDPNRHTVIYSDWGGNEPNNFGTGEDYLEFDPARGGEWNDAAGAPHLYDGYYVEFSAVPEPSSFVLGIVGLAGLGFATLRKKFRLA